MLRHILSFALVENIAMSVMDVSPDIMMYLHSSAHSHLEPVNDLSVIICAG